MSGGSMQSMRRPSLSTTKYAPGLEGEPWSACAAGAAGAAGLAGAGGSAFGGAASAAVASGAGAAIGAGAGVAGSAFSDTLALDWQASAERPAARTRRTPRRVDAEAEAID